MPKWVWMVLVMKYGEITRTANHTAGEIRLFLHQLKFDEILKQRDKYHADNMETMSINDYRAFLETGALIEKDQHGFVRCALSGEMLAVNPEQIDALIEFLKGIRD